MSAVVFDHVDIVFGDKQAEALALIDRGATRDEILKTTGVVLGAAGVDLAIEPSEICVLMGLSGSGKSTILRAVNGLNKVARGKVLVDHRGGAIDVAHCSADQLRMLRTSRIAMVFQQFALLPWRTVKENVAFGLELRRMPKAEIDRIVADKLAMVGLTQWAGKFGHELSGGMQQRVGLARAFATDADILLMDEPFSALDPLIRDKLQDELLASAEGPQEDDHFRQPRSRRGAQDRQPDRHSRRRAHRPVRHGGGHPAASRQRLCRRIRQAHEPAQRAARRRADDARGVAAAPQQRGSSRSKRPSSRSSSTRQDRPIGVTLDGKAGAIAVRTERPAKCRRGPRTSTSSSRRSI